MVPTNPRMHYDLGVLMNEAQEETAALQSYERAVAVCPYHADAMINGGVTLMNLKRLDEAVGRLRTAIDVYPMADKYGLTTFMPGVKVFPYLNLGLALLRLNRFDEARAVYQEAGAKFLKDKRVRAEAGLLEERIATRKQRLAAGG